MSNPLVALGQLGQSPWYDFITRDLVRSGELARLIREDGLLGMTSNPTIFEKAVAGSSDYDADIRQLTAAGKKTFGKLWAVGEPIRAGMVGALGPGEAETIVGLLTRITEALVADAVPVGGPGSSHTSGDET